MRVDSIRFGAKYVTSPKIQVKSSSAVYYSHPVSFVELEPGNRYDIDAVARTSSLWGQNTFAHEICVEMEKAARSLKNTKDKFFALTIQMDDFEKINENKFLGIVAVDTKNEEYNDIKYLQANPKYMYREKEQPVIKHIGKSILRSLKKGTDKDLEAEILPSAKLFYEQCGFKETEIPNIVRWEKPSA